MGLTSASRYLTFSSCIAAFIATVFHAVAFGTRKWLECPGNSPFEAIGFHEACFDQCYNPYCPSGDPDFVYHGCWWLYDYHFREIWTWLMPNWWDQCRNMAIVNVPLITICFIVLIICSIITLLGNSTTEEHRTRDTILLVLLYVVSVFLFVATLLCLLTLTQFFSNAFKYDYMPMPDKNRLGWSYWLEVVAALFLIYASVATLLAAIFKTLRKFSEKNPSFSDDMMMGRRY